MQLLADFTTKYDGQENKICIHDNSERERKRDREEEGKKRRAKEMIKSNWAAQMHISCESNN